MDQKVEEIKSIWRWNGEPVVNNKKEIIIKAERNFEINDDKTLLFWKTSDWDYVLHTTR